MLWNEQEIDTKIIGRKLVVHSSSKLDFQCLQGFLKTVHDDYIIIYNQINNQDWFAWHGTLRYQNLRGVCICGVDILFINVMFTFLGLLFNKCVMQKIKQEVWKGPMSVLLASVFNRSQVHTKILFATKWCDQLSQQTKLCISRV